MNSPKVLISVLNWNNAPASIACLESLTRLNYTNYKIIVTDNDSTDDSVEQIRNIYPDIVIHENQKNQGFAAGHEYAANYAITNNYDALWILNNDTRVYPDALQALVKAWKSKPAAIYGSLILEADGVTVRFGGSYPVNKQTIDYSEEWNRLKGRLLSHIKAEELLHEVADVNGSSIFISTKLMKDFGFMPTDYFLYSEETHYCYYLRTKGIPSVLVPDSRVIHAGSQSFTNSKLNWLAYYYRLRNNLLLEKSFGISNNRKILKGKSLINYWLPFAVKSILRILGYKKMSLQHYWQQLAVWHALRNKKGKTLPPEKYLNE